MTLIGAILKKVKSSESLSQKYVSPPPETEETIKPKRRKYVNKFGRVPARVDSSPPRCAPRAPGTPGTRRALLASRLLLARLHADNARLVSLITKAHFTGKVDCRWERALPGSRQYYEARENFLKNVQAENRLIYKRIVATGPRVVPTGHLRREWRAARREMIRRATGPFVLFPPVPAELVEDPAFLPPAGVMRPRVYLTLRIVGGAELGTLCVELFPDACPATCRLFFELLDGDGLGHGYVGTTFFRKVPGLYWSGGDVIYDNGFGCYAQRGRTVPIGAEKYHFSHSMPGLLSMRVTKDDEMCGIFNITFKALPQFDLKSEVFGRVIRPCSTFASLSGVCCPQSPLSPRPTVALAGARRRVARQWRRGTPNTRLIRDWHTLHTHPSQRGA